MRLSGRWALCCCSSSCCKRFELEVGDDRRLDGTLVIWVAALEKLPIACARGATREAVSLAVSPEVREPLRLDGLLASWVAALEKVSVTSPGRILASEAVSFAAGAPSIACGPETNPSRATESALTEFARFKMSGVSPF